MQSLKTENLLLRPMTINDVDFIFSIISDPETMQYYPAPYDMEGATKWVTRNLQRYEEHGCGFYVICDGKTGTAYGQGGVLIQDVEDELIHEVGYLIHRNFWRRGIATEAAIACRDSAFTDLNAPAVHSIIRPNNLPSQGVARKMQMEPRPEKIKFHGLEHLLFRISRDDWNRLGS